MSVGRQAITAAGLAGQAMAAMAGALLMSGCFREHWQTGSLWVPVVVVVVEQIPVPRQPVEELVAVERQDPIIVAERPGMLFQGVWEPTEEFPVEQAGSVMEAITAVPAVAAALAAAAAAERADRLTRVQPVRLALVETAVVPELAAVVAAIMAAAALLPEITVTPAAAAAPLIQEHSPPLLLQEAIKPGTESSILPMS